MPVTRIKPLYNLKGNLIGYVDKYTGEEYGFPVIVGRKKNPYSKDWIMNNQSYAFKNGNLILKVTPSQV